MNINPVTCTISRYTFTCYESAVVDTLTLYDNKIQYIKGISILLTLKVLLRHTITAKHILF